MRLLILIKRPGFGERFAYRDAVFASQLGRMESDETGATFLQQLLRVTRARRNCAFLSAFLQWKPPRIISTIITLLALFSRSVANKSRPPREIARDRRSAVFVLLSISAGIRSVALYIKITFIALPHPRVIFLRSLASHARARARWIYIAAKYTRSTFENTR